MKFIVYTACFIVFDQLARLYLCFSDCLKRDFVVTALELPRASTRIVAASGSGVFSPEFYRFSKRAVVGSTNGDVAGVNEKRSSGGWSTREAEIVRKYRSRDTITKDRGGERIFLPALEIRAGVPEARAEIYLFRDFSVLFTVRNNFILSSVEFPFFSFLHFHSSRSLLEDAEHAKFRAAGE